MRESQGRQDEMFGGKELQVLWTFIEITNRELELWASIGVGESVGFSLKHSNGSLGYTRLFLS